MSKSDQPATVAVDRGVRPRAWLTSEPDGNDGDGSFGGIREGVEIGAERPDFGTEPLYDQAALDAAVAAERERWAQRVEAAFREGFIAPATYNDKVENDVDEEWERAKASLLGA